MNGYRERLRVPIRWWVQWTVMVATFWLAMVVAVPEWLAWTVTALLLALMAVLLSSYGSPRIVVTDDWLSAGSARIERRFTGAVAALDAEAMRRQAGRDANARAYQLVRPYISTGVRVAIDDPSDPTPYWLLSSRRATELAAALGHEPEAPAQQLGDDGSAAAGGAST
ncbi:DUF3093 domain-containing protein [Nocardioides glacieisoli]|uniref:DUF3093 domain-containing protein n=1 Tax=Nocardioides glacieisoli TaxID=1168730 RepID=A0A4Q2RN68_9ACTN|nr:DUF3093 domain-containing protein [Nocardioides glacieisoli]RYB89079.1 DUF3093 domain-containing protein [Nocardioides glacieisoli]